MVVKHGSYRRGGALGIRAAQVGVLNGGLLASLADGTNDYLSGGPDLPDSKLVTVSFWITSESVPSATEYALISSASRFKGSIGTNQKFRLDLQTSSGTDVGVYNNPDETLSTSFLHYAFSIDAGNNIYQARANGVDTSSKWVSKSDNVIRLGDLLSIYATNSGSAKANIKLSELWIFSGVQVDLDTYINDFYGGGTPPYLGANGELPGGAGQPHVYSPDGGPTNYGSLGDFTENGALESVDGPGA